MKQASATSQTGLFARASNLPTPRGAARRFWRFGRSHPALAAGLAVVLAGAFSAQANNYVVTSTAPLGPGSLDDAITQANANPGLDFISFSFAAYPVKISPVGPLPDIVDSVVIDATASPDCLATYEPRVELDGSLAGPNANGLTALGTAAGPIGVTIKGLVIRSFSGAGIRLLRNTNSVIQGNYLGTDPSGSFSLPNLDGLVVESCTDVLVGGTNNCERNLLSGNLGGGLSIFGGANNLVFGNYIGLAANGVWPVPNQFGVYLVACNRCWIGSTAAGQGNVIVRNTGPGVMVNGPLGIRMDSVIEGNSIGTLPDGTPAPNTADGVYFFGGPTGNFVRQNRIAYNGGAGVMVLEGTDNTIVENSIYNNNRLGIDITPRLAPNPNDGCDADAGPNREQNFPILTAADNLGGALLLAGALDSEPALPFRLDFYWQSTCDPFGFGQGRHYIGQATVGPSVSGACVNNFSVSFPVEVPAGSVVTATATHPEGSTSEFSPCVPVTYLGTNIVIHEGLPHQPLGGATLTENNGWLDVSLFNGGGSNGVRLALGRAEGWQAALDAFELLPGDSYQLSVQQDSAALNPQPQPPVPVSVATASLSAGSNGLTFRGHFTPGGSNLPMNLRLEFRDDYDRLVSVVRIPNGGEYNLPPCTNIYQQYIVCSNAFVSLQSGEPAFCWRFCRVTCIPPGPYPGAPYFPPERVATWACLIAEVPWRSTMECIVCRRPDVGTNQTAGTISLTADLGPNHADGGHLRLGQEWVQQFGRFHQASGPARLTGWRGTSPGGLPESLMVTLPMNSTSGPMEGGTVLALDRQRYISATLDVDTSVAQLPWWFGIKVGTNHISDTTTVARQPAGVGISFGFDLSGADSGQLAFYRQGTLVGSLVASTGALVSAGSPPLRLAAATSPYTPLASSGFGLFWPDAVSLIIIGMPSAPAGSGQEFLADELRITPVNPAKPLPWLTHFDVMASGLSGFEISGEDARPAVPPPLNIQLVGREVLLSFPTESGRLYQIEFKNSLADPRWQVLDTYMCDGSVKQVSLPAVQNGSQFYRLGGF